MKRYEVIVIGAGPAGLCAATEAAEHGCKVIVFDENAKPGGQLFKQIHKFFGSREHMAKTRGFQIGKKLLEDAVKTGVDVRLNSVVTGLYLDKEVVVKNKDHIEHYKGDKIIIATGASENSVAFEGWTLPGVMGAGAAQTMMNLHGIKPGKKVLMIGTGNVGLVVSYQLLQAGCEVVALADALPYIGGYGVHAAKLARCGVPFYMSHTIIKAQGSDCVTGAVIGQLGADKKIISGTEKHFDVDTICLAVGLSPMSQLAKMAGCRMEYNSAKGGLVPVYDEFGETSVPGIFAAGDVSGIEEASSAMIEGRIAGITCAYQCGYLSREKAENELKIQAKALNALRKGMFAPGNKGKFTDKTQENIQISSNLREKGFLKSQELERFPGVKHIKGTHPVIECTQNIPCNPCQDACRKGCITVGNEITGLPEVCPEAECTGCGMCVASCSGQAIFLINEDYEEKYAAITMPYEFYPCPAPGEKGVACDRSGNSVCEAEVIALKTSPVFDKTNLLTIKVPVEWVNEARFYKPSEDAI